ncbi:MAG: hypothetical protein LBJ67_06855 [Planctomycetaceae bacterium]|jgi:type IV secretory pathway VirB2 component (pilin)|nr:hypothetical protein [Planctomycetaceae bacterium]
MKKLNLFFIKLYCYSQLYKYEYTNIITFCFGIFIITFALSGITIAQESGTTSSSPSGSSQAATIIRDQMCKILQLIEGPFGALIMVVAGLAAVVTAAMGAYKMAMSCVVIACGSYLVTAFGMLFFGEDILCGSRFKIPKEKRDKPCNTEQLSPSLLSALV